MIGVVHLIWGPLGPGSLRTFLDSYRTHRAGEEHELVMLLNGVRDDQRASFLAELEDVPHRLLELDEPVQDLVAYGQAARRLEHERLCFVNSHSVILAPDWLVKLNRALDEPRAGLVGVSGSWGSIRSYLRFSLGLGGFYGRVFEDRRATNAALEALTARQSQAAPNHASRRRVPVVSYALAVLDQAHGFTSFPAHHMRTTGFMIGRELFARLQVPRLRSKNDAYRFESGRRSITAQVAALGLGTLVVGRDGLAYGPSEWHTSHTFWQGDQENLLIADKQTESYEQGDAPVREILSRYAWGEQADATKKLI